MKKNIGMRTNSMRKRVNVILIGFFINILLFY